MAAFELVKGNSGLQRIPTLDTVSLNCVDVSYERTEKLELYEPNAHKLYGNRSTESLLKPST